MNLVPDRYRSVAVAEVEAPLDDEGLRALFLGRRAYRRTRYVVVRAAAGTAVVEVDKRAERAGTHPRPAGADPDEPLFQEITAVRMLAGPHETASVRSPDTDVGVPSQLADAAAVHAPGARCVVIEGRYQHVSFIMDPAPVRLAVVEVVPPRPPKLFDQVRRVLDVADDLPPVELVPELLDLAEMARQRPSAHYLLPCRGGGARIAGARVSYLDEAPQPADWTLIGCARSREIHGWYYGTQPPSVEMCPRTLAAGPARPAGTAVLTKCCLLEEHIERSGEVVVVPWGASLAEIRDGVAAAVTTAHDRISTVAS